VKIKENRMFRTLLALLVGVVFSVGSSAQNDRMGAQLSRITTPSVSSNQETQIGALTPAATSDCTYTFTSGGTATVKFLQYCITVNGNVVEFQSPLGAEHIRVGTVGDGYALCDLSAATGEVGYHDYAGFGDVDTGTGWAAPVLQSQTATVVKIARSTSDGLWTLTQTFTQSAADASVRVAMAIKNNTAVSRTIWLTRFTDIDANNSTSNIMDGTVESVWGYSASETGSGLQISLAMPNAFNNFGLAENTVENACSIGRNFNGLLNGVDGFAYSFHFIVVPAHGSKTVTLKYKAI
jgi:hypothetical protein